MYSGLNPCLCHPPSTPCGCTGQPVPSRFLVSSLVVQTNHVHGDTIRLAQWWCGGTDSHTRAKVQKCVRRENVLLELKCHSGHEWGLKVWYASVAVPQDHGLCIEWKNRFCDVRVLVAECAHRACHLCSPVCARLWNPDPLYEGPDHNHFRARCDTFIFVFPPHTLFRYVGRSMGMAVCGRGPPTPQLVERGWRPRRYWCVSMGKLMRDWCMVCLLTKWRGVRVCAGIRINMKRGRVAQQGANCPALFRDSAKPVYLHARLH